MLKSQGLILADKLKDSPKLLKELENEFIVKTLPKFGKAIELLEKVNLGSAKLLLKDGSYTKVIKDVHQYQVIKFKNGKFTSNQYYKKEKFEENYRWFI